MFALKAVKAGLLGAALLLPLSAVAQYGYPSHYAGGGYYQDGWDAPPGEYTRDLQRDGFHAGIDGARKDAENHRSPNVNNRDEFRHYRGPERRVWREAFARGYNAFWNHQGFRGY